MHDTAVWIIIIAFYAPLHYVLPLLALFITGQESESERKTLIRGAFIDSTLSMLLALTSKPSNNIQTPTKKPS